MKKSHKYLNIDINRRLFLGAQMTKPNLTHYFHSIAIDKENKHLLFSLRQGPNLYPFFPNNTRV